MSKKVTPEETKALFGFCHKHYVSQYDLQIELVDHLASAIEEQWKENRDLPFQKALMNSFGKFGIYGFSKIKKQKEKELNRKYNKVLFDYFFEFYRWPKLLMTLAFTFLFLTILQITGNGVWVMSAYFVGLIIFIGLYYYLIFPKKYKIQTVSGKSFLILKRLKDVQLAGVFIVQLPIQGYQFWNIFEFNSIQNIWALGAISFFTVGLTIFIYGNFFYLPQKIRGHFMAQFAEFVK
jgi:hypothetical protein